MFRRESKAAGCRGAEGVKRPPCNGTADLKWGGAVLQNVLVLCRRLCVLSTAPNTLRLG